MHPGHAYITKLLVAVISGALTESFVVKLSQNWVLMPQLMENLHESLLGKRPWVIFVDFCNSFQPILWTFLVYIVRCIFVCTAAMLLYCVRAQQFADAQTSVYCSVITVHRHSNFTTLIFHVIVDINSSLVPFMKWLPVIAIPYVKVFSMDSFISVRLVRPRQMNFMFTRTCNLHLWSVLYDLWSVLYNFVRHWHCCLLLKQVF